MGFGLGRLCLGLGLDNLQLSPKLKICDETQTHHLGPPALELIHIMLMAVDVELENGDTQHEPRLRQGQVGQWD